VHIRVESFKLRTLICPFEMTIYPFFSQILLMDVQFLQRLFIVEISEMSAGDTTPKAGDR
jgi:hypothetical protein